MPCYHPLHGFEGPVNENGKRPVVFKAPSGTKRIDVPCGQCIGCRIDRSRNMALRCMHEASCHRDNSFLTLTFNDEALKLRGHGSVDIRDFQLFMKRVRKKYGQGPRYYHCGEYGDKLGRPHYHALMFGLDFPDKVLHTVRDDKRYYTSEELSSLWPQGHSLISDVTFESAAYVARYVMKKVNFSDKSPGKFFDHYVDKHTGEVLNPEYASGSRRPGIGASWFEKFQGDVYPSDSVVLRGNELKPPRYYDYLLDKKDADLLEEVKVKRLKSVDVFENTDDRLAVREECKLAQIKNLRRSYEEGT